jgi:hypothetical protein
LIEHRSIAGVELGDWSERRDLADEGRHKSIVTAKDLDDGGRLQG